MPKRETCSILDSSFQIELQLGSQTQTPGQPSSTASFPDSTPVCIQPFLKGRSQSKTCQQSPTTPPKKSKSKLVVSRHVHLVWLALYLFTPPPSHVTHPVSSASWFIHMKVFTTTFWSVTARWCVGGLQPRYTGYKGGAGIAGVWRVSGLIILTQNRNKMCRKFWLFLFLLLLRPSLLLRPKHNFPPT